MWNSAKFMFGIPKKNKIYVEKWEWNTNTFQNEIYTYYFEIFTIQKSIITMSLIASILHCIKGYAAMSLTYIVGVYVVLCNSQKKLFDSSKSVSGQTEP